MSLTSLVSLVSLMSLMSLMRLMSLMSLMRLMSLVKGDLAHIVSIQCASAHVEFNISQNYSKYTKSFEHVFIMSKIRGPRYYFEAISFEPNSLLRISEISEMLQSEFGSEELASK